MSPCSRLWARLSCESPLGRELGLGRGRLAAAALAVRPARLLSWSGGLFDFGRVGFVEGDGVAEGFELALQAAGAVLD